jgi:hypothetical protein
MNGWTDIWSPWDEAFGVNGIWKASLQEGVAMDEFDGVSPILHAAKPRRTKKVPARLRMVVSKGKLQAVYKKDNTTFHHRNGRAYSSLSVRLVS